jgi:hypothetical protein
VSGNASRKIAPGWSWHVAVALAMAACWTAPRSITNDGPAVAPVSASSLETALRARTITDEDFYRPVLYTWTTPEAITRLRTTHQLLVATATSGGFTSPFNRAVIALSAGHTDAAKIAQQLLSNPGLMRRRYAWPSPFATVMGVGKRTYGTALIRIVLRPDAWIGRFEPEAREPFSFVDAQRTPVAIAAVLAHPERIGAIYHVRTESSLAVRFREYVVCNEAMVASWSIATPAIRAELDEEIALLRAMREWVAVLPDDATRLPAFPRWGDLPPASDPMALWHAVLAFDNHRYRPRRRQLDAILETLAGYDPAGEPLSVTP